MLKFYQKKLKNNLSLLIIKTKKLSSLDITLYIKSGSVYENKSNNGISHLLEHLLFLKTKQSKLNPIALDIYPYTKKDFTFFEITTHKDLLNIALENLFIVINSPDFTEENLKIIKSIVKEELVDFYENPYDTLNQEIDKYLYQGSSLALSILGDEKSIDNITIEDLKAWYDKYYQPANMVLSLVGDVSVTELLKNINSYLQPDKPVEDSYNDKISYPATSGPVYLKSRINFQQTYLAFVFPTADIGDSDYIGLVLLSEILNKKLRQSFENSGLLYDIQLYYQPYSKAGEFRIITACKKSNVKKILEKFDTFVEECEISTSSFESIKDYIKYQFMLKEDNVDDLSSLALYLLNDDSKLTSLEDELEMIKSIQFKDINRIKRKVFNKKNSHYFIMN